MIDSKKIPRLQGPLQAGLIALFWHLFLHEQARPDLAYKKKLKRTV